MAGLNFYAFQGRKMQTKSHILNLEHSKTYWNRQCVLAAAFNTSHVMYDCNVPIVLKLVAI